MNIESADSDAWNTANGQHQGRPTLIRYRPALVKHLGDARYPQRLTISWDFPEMNASGLPEKDQSDSMKTFEDKLIDAVDPDRLAVLAFVFTGSGVREWHFYVGDLEAVGERINNALANEPVLPIDLQVDDDPMWNELRHVIEMCH